MKKLIPVYKAKFEITQNKMDEAVMTREAV